jgi:hypothetical protein
MHITVILAFKVILGEDIYIITIYIDNSIDMLINIECFEMENRQFLQIRDNFVLCLHSFRILTRLTRPSSLP